MGDMLGSVGGLIGGIVGNNEAAGQQAAAGNDLQQALNNYENIQVPTIAEQEWNPELETSAGTLSPESMSAAQIGANAMQGIQTNPAYTQAQNAQLAALQQLGQGGMTAQEQQNLIQSQQAAAGQAQAQNAAILQQQAARGMGGSGAQLAAQLSNSQNSANQASNNANAINAMAQQNALGAMAGAGSLASQLQQSQFGQQAAIAQSQNAINQFNAMNQQNTNAYNTQAQNAAQSSNLQNAQNISNTNTQLGNQAQQHNTGLYQTQFGNQMSQAQGEANALNNQSTYNQNQANATRGQAAGVGSAIGDLAGEATSDDPGGFFSGSSSGSSGSSSSSEPDWANAPDASDMWYKGGRVGYAQGGQVVPQQPMALPMSQASQQMTQGLSPAQLASIQAILAQKSPAPQGNMTLGLPGGSSVAPNQNAPVAGGYANGGQVKKGTDLSPAALEKLGHFMAQFGKDKKNQAKEAQKLANGGNVLNANARAHIAPHNFALPNGRYPIEDANHARNALARVAQHGTPEEQARVRAAVHSKYPSIGQHAQGGMINPPDYNQGGQVHNHANLEHLKQNFNKFISEEEKEKGPKGYAMGGVATGPGGNFGAETNFIPVPQQPIGGTPLSAMGGGGGSGGGGPMGSIMQLAPLAMMAMNKGGEVPHMSQGGQMGADDIAHRMAGLAPLVAMAMAKGGKIPPSMMYEGGNLTGLPHAPPAKKPDSNDMNQSYADGGQVDDSGNLPLSTRQQMMQSIANTFAPQKAVPKQYAQGALPNAEDAAAAGEAETMTPAQKAELAQTQAAMAKFNALRGMTGAGGVPGAPDGVTMVAPQQQQGMSRGGKVDAVVSPQERYYNPKQVDDVVKGKKEPKETGKVFKGEAKVKGDSPKNDIIPTKLDVGGIVIPRTVAKKSDDEILDFVKKAREGKRK